MKKLILFFIASATVLIVNAQSQTWERVIDRPLLPEAAGVWDFVVNNNSWYAVGSSATNALGNSVGMVLKVRNSDGTILDSLPFTNVDLVAISVLPNQNMAVVGYTNSWNHYICAIDTNLNVVWQDSTDSKPGWASQMVTDVNGDIIAVEHSFGSAPNFVDTNVFHKYDVNGNILWTKVKTGISYFHGLRAFKNGFSLIRGNSKQIDFFSDQGDSIGNLSFKDTLIILNPGSCIYDKDFFYITGVEWLDNDSAFVAKIDTLGNTVWKRKFSGDKVVLAGSLTHSGAIGVDIEWNKDSTKILLAGGVDRKINMEGEVFCAVLDTGSNWIWQKVIEVGQRYSFATQIQEVDDQGGIGLSGAVHYSVHNTDGAMYLLKMDSLGNYTPASAIVEGEQLSVSVYPNPSTSSFTVILSETKNLSNVQLSVVNMLGQEVEALKQVQGDKVVINASEWESGLYFIRLSDGERSYTAKVVKE